MQNIDREGTFRGTLIDHGVSLTKNGYPQFVAKFLGTEIWDEEEKKWVDWTDMEENTIVAYLVLFGADGDATLNCTQVQQVTGWDGETFQSLQNMDLSKVPVQVRVGPNTYQDVTTLQVEWIDSGDVTPGSGVKKLDDNDLKKLDAKYSAKLKGKAPAKANGKKKPAKTNGKKKPAKTPAKTTPPAPTATEKEAEQCTKSEAWDTCCELKHVTVTDQQLTESWVKHVSDATKKTGGTEEDFTDFAWAAIRDLVLAETAMF